MMPKSVSRTIVPQEDGDLEIKGRKYDGSRDRDTMLEILSPIPMRPYRVTYTLSDEGEYEVYRGISPSVSLRRVGHAFGRIVCFLPSKWNGKKVNRTVEVMF